MPKNQKVKEKKKQIDHHFNLYDLIDKIYKYNKLSLTYRKSVNLVPIIKILLTKLINFVYFRN